MRRLLASTRCAPRYGVSTRTIAGFQAALARVAQIGRCLTMRVVTRRVGGTSAARSVDGGAVRTGAIDRRPAALAAHGLHDDASAARHCGRQHDPEHATLTCPCLLRRRPGTHQQSDTFVRPKARSHNDERPIGRDPKNRRDAIGACVCTGHRQQGGRHDSESKHSHRASMPGNDEGPAWRRPLAP